MDAIRGDDDDDSDSEANIEDTDIEDSVFVDTTSPTTSINQLTTNNSDNIDSMNSPESVNQESSSLSLSNSSNIKSSAISISSNKSPTKKRRLSESVVPEEEDDGQSCPICLEIWTTSGDHRLCALKCGHLFGSNCIKRWLTAESQKCCPTCKNKAHLRDIRYIYARKIVAMDTTELTIAKRDTAIAIEEKNRMHDELARAVCREHTLLRELQLYKKKLDMLKTMAGVNQINTFSNMQSELVQIYKEKTIDLGKNCGCRVFDCNNNLDTIAVSIKSSNNLYSGFGIKKFSITSYKATAYIPLHTQPIRDMKFHGFEPWLLTCSIDKKIKITDMKSNTGVVNFESESSLWSCCWDSDHHSFYVGQQQGSVLKYDFRKLTGPESTMSVYGDLSPVVSVQAIPPSSMFPKGGVASCKLNSTSVFEWTANDPVCHRLFLEGPFVSMTYKQDSEHLFISSRPSSKYCLARHVLCALNKDDNQQVRGDIIHSFHGGSTQKMLTRSCLLSSKSDYAAAYIEDQNIVALWCLKSGNRVGTVPAHESVLDLNSLNTNNNDFLLSLTESKLEIFKFAN